MLISQLNIQRFRGVSGSLQLDLSSPLTVVYAPNGTGKTSICDAAEWMLCGHIGRLNTLDENEVKSRFGEDNLETFVEAKFLDRNKPYALKRILENNGSILQRKIGSGEYSKVTDKELLGLIVDAIPPSGRSPKAQIAWVRSTRFLESDSLNLLIDSDDESNNTRKLIFSNLFGVGDYQKAENNLNKILNKLPASSTIIREKSRLSKRISDYDKAITKLVSEQGEPYRDHVLNLLNSVAERLGTNVDFDKNMSLTDYHKQLEVKFIQSAEYLANQNTSLAFIKENLPVYQENQSKAEELDKTSALENKDLIALNASFKQKKERLDKKQKVFEQREELINEITAASEEFKITKVEFNRLYEIYKLPNIETENRLNELSAYVFTNEGKITDSKEKVILVEKCINLLPTWVDGQDTLKGISIELEALQTSQSQENAEDSLPEQISKVNAKLDALKTSREKVLGELDLLLSSGKKYVEMHERVSECPLCEHNYDNNSALLEKINNRFSKLTNKSKEEAALTSKHAELTKLLEQGNARLRKLHELMSSKNNLIQQAQEIEVKFVSAGITKNDLAEKDALSLKLETIHKQHLSDTSNLSEMLIPYKKAVDAGKKLEEILNRVKPVAFSWVKKLEQPNYEELQSIEDLERTIDDLLLLLKSHSAQKKQQQEEEKQKIKEGTSELSKIEGEKNKKALLVSSFKEKLSAAKSAIEDFKKKWAILPEVSTIDEIGRAHV